MAALEARKGKPALGRRSPRRTNEHRSYVGIVHAPFTHRSRTARRRGFHGGGVALFLKLGPRWRTRRERENFSQDLKGCENFS